MRPIVHTKGPMAAASANNICLAQQPTVAAGFTLNGALASAGVATLDVARRVLFTTTEDDSGKTFTITGTDSQGRVISESLAGPNTGTAYTVYDYKTVTSITTNSTVTANLTVGTNAVASSIPLPLDHYLFPEISAQTKVTGAINYSVQYTLDDPFALPVAALNWVDFPDPNFLGVTVGATGGCQFIPTALRLLINDGSGGGSVTLTILQPGIMG